MTYSLKPPRWIGAVVLNLCTLSTVFLKYLRDLDLDSFFLRCIVFLRFIILFYLRRFVLVFFRGI